MCLFTMKALLRWHGPFDVGHTGDVRTIESRGGNLGDLQWRQYRTVSSWSFSVALCGSGIFLTKMDPNQVIWRHCGIPVTGSIEVQVGQTLGCSGLDRDGPALSRSWTR